MPCVAAYSLRSAGTIVRPATSTIGSPLPASVQVAGRSRKGNDAEVGRDVQVARDGIVSEARDRQVGQRVAVEVRPRRRCAIGSYVTENTCPGSAGVLKLYPVYEIQAWFTLFGSMAMDVIERCGSFVAGLAFRLSIRVQLTAVGSAASALCVTNTRPPLVAAQIVPVSTGVRAIHETQQRAAATAVGVRRQIARAPDADEVTAVGSAPETKNSGQFALRTVGSPPQSWVRHTLCEPS